MEDPGEKIKVVSFAVLIIGVIISFIMFVIGLVGNYPSALLRGVQIGNALMYGFITIVAFFVLYGFGTLVDNSDILVSLKVEELKMKRAEKAEKDKEEKDKKE